MLVSLIRQGVSAISLIELVTIATASRPHVSAAPTAASTEGREALLTPALPGVPADVGDTLPEALLECLGACLSSLLDGGSQKEEEATAHLQGIVRCLAGQGGSNQDNEAEALMGSLRNTAWQLMQECVDQLEPTAYSRAAVVELLDTMATIISQQVIKA